MMNKNEWKKVKLEDIGEIITGITPSTSNNEFYNKKEIPFYKPNDLVDDKIKFLNEATVYISNLARTKAKIIKEKSVLVTCIGIIGKVAIINREGAFNQQINCITPNESICDINYLAFAIKSKQKYMQYVANSAIVPIINKTQFSNIEILLPNIETQKIISKKLNIIQKIIEMKQQQLFEFEKLVKFQFLKMFGMGSNDMKHIGDIANICRGASPRPISKYVTNENDGVNWIKIGDVSEKDIYITHTSEKITKDGAKKSRAVEPGDFILSNSMSFGRPYLVGINGCVHDGWLIISGYQEYLDPLFFYYELRSDLVQRQFNGSANGSCVKNLNSDLVKKIKIYVPPKEQQILFADFVKQVDKSKVELQKSIDETQLLFDSLMDKYFG